MENNHATFGRAIYVRIVNLLFTVLSIHQQKYASVLYFATRTASLLITIVIINPSCLH